MNALSLYEINNLVKEALKTCFPQRYWIHAELSEVHENVSGHCYLEFIEKTPRSGQIIAKAKGMIWATTYKLLKPYFETNTGQRFAAGIKVMVEVSPTFHEQYGYSLTVHNINPEYTLGDLALQRKKNNRPVDCRRNYRYEPRIGMANRTATHRCYLFPHSRRIRRLLQSAAT